tara:strand:- start:976 stop:1944 length:969 start_codon:yes stop_codon:yes gene_type:complete
MSQRDKTLKDNNRRNLLLHDCHSIREVLPAYFLEEYPKLVSFLEAYYEWEDSGKTPSKLIHDLFLNRDITATDISNLSFIEDELLLGQQYFEGFQNKRSAAKYSNTLYRSKGTLFSIEQFFRSFFSISPDVVYTKENIFNVGENTSLIGPESLKYLVDDKLYQKYALLVKAPIPISQWKEAYKLFVHPAGMYIGGEVQLVSQNVNDLLVMPDVIIADQFDPIYEGVATAGLEAQLDITGLRPRGVFLDSDTRISLNGQVEDYATRTIEEIGRNYDTIEEWIGTNSPTFDEDSAVGDPYAPRMSTELDTFDEVNYIWYDSDSA